MTKTRLLSTVAASLLLSAGIASAQSPNTQQAPARAPAAQQSAPAEKVAPPMNAGERKGPATTGQAQHEKPGAATTGQAPKEPAGEMKGKPADGMKGTPDQRGGADMKAKPEQRGGAAMKPNAEKQGPPATNKNAADEKRGAPDANKNAADRHGPPDVKQSAGQKSTVTTGQGAAAAAKLSPEQRTKITTVLKKQKVESVHLNITVNVGTRITENVRFYPLPTEVVEVYPEWRGYEYILVDGRIVIIEPSSREIVFVIES
jgi:hypothetical protein